MSPRPQQVTRADVVLIVAAMVGLAVYVTLMPAQHPDAAARFTPGHAAVHDAAEAFLAASGYEAGGLLPEVQLRRHETLLAGLQDSLGRPETVRVLRAEAPPLPAYFWRVRYLTTGDLNTEAGDERFAVSLSQDLKVWDFEKDVPAPSTRGRLPALDRGALRTVLATPADAATTPAVDFNALSDSLLAALSFNPGDSLWRQPPEGLPVFDGAAVLATLTGRDSTAARARLGPGFAVALARYHLGRSLWAPDGFRVDSVWTAPERNDRVARVRFVARAPILGQQIRPLVEVSATGMLQDLDTTVNPGTGEESSTLDVVIQVIAGALWVLLLLMLVIAFFRRLGARRIDVKAAMLDAVLLGLLTAVGVVLLKELQFVEGEITLWQRVLITLLAMSLSGGVVALFTFLVSGAADSVTREVWPKKLRTASLVRLGNFRNTYVGGALLRGVGLSAVLLGLSALYLFFVPGAALTLDTSAFMSELAYQPMALAAAFGGLATYIMMVVLLLGVGTFFYRLNQQGWMTGLALVLFSALLMIELPELDPYWHRWVLGALTGGVLALALWRFDFVAGFTGYFLAMLVWGVDEGWLVQGSPAWLDVLLAGLLVTGVLGLGLVGVLAGRRGRDVIEYVPSYVQEMAQQERMERELEIAHQVQDHLLPRRMPNVSGLDIAGMCLPAQEVGGDYYDFIELEPGRLAVVIGDVSGKGIQAAFYMTLTKGIIQTLSRSVRSPAEVMRRLNSLFCINVPRGVFISMIYGVFDVEARTFTFARAGHNPIILKRSPSQAPELFQPAGLGIGLINGRPFDEVIQEQTLHLRPGDVLVFYTDGFSEAMNMRKELYGDERLAQKVGDLGPRSANELLRAISEDVHHFVEAAGRHDDMTMVVVKMMGRAGYRAPAADVSAATMRAEK